MKRRTSRPASRLVARTALASAAGLAVLTSGVGAALADEVTVPDDLDPSSQTPDGDGSAETPPATSEETPPVPPAETDGAVEGGGDAEGPDAVAPGADTPDDEAEAPAPVVAPNYGTQKLRVGVQQADGSWIDRAASFAGTTVTITLTGGVDAEGQPLPDASTSCTVVDDSTIEELVLDQERPFYGQADCAFTSGGEGVDGVLFELAPGQRAVVTPDPASAPTGIELDPAPIVVEPCVAAEVPEPFECGGLGSIVSAVVEATGPSPVVGDDVIEVAPGQTVDIDVLANDVDVPCAPVTGAALVEAPAAGTAAIVGGIAVMERPADCDVTPPVVTPPVVVALAETAAITAPSNLRLRYTAPVGFAGVDTLSYALTSINGTRTGTVRVNVVAPVVIPPVTGPVNVGDLGSGTGRRASNGTLPSTGGPAAELLALGVVLVAAGVGATAIRRRDPRGLVG